MNPPARPRKPAAAGSRQVRELRTRLREAEEALRAIRNGEVDAIIVSGNRGEQVFSLNTPDDAYRQIVQTMNEAALTTTPDGRILFCNAQFERLVGIPMEELVGTPLAGLVEEQAAERMASLIEEAGTSSRRQRVVFAGRSGPVPTLVSAGPLMQRDGMGGVCFVATDLTEVEASEVLLAQQTEELRAAVEELQTEVGARTRMEEELRKSTRHLRALAGELALTEQRERRRLAALLHDSLQQILVAIRLQIESLKARSGAEAEAKVDQIYELAGQALEMSRILTAELCPPVLHTSGLGPTLQWLAQWMKAKHGLEVSLSTPARLPRMDEDVAVQLFQSTRELLFNVVKHAGVRKASLAMNVESADLRIVVRDEGGGFDPVAVRQRTGTESFGLFSIQERLALIGGTLAIQSSPGRGSRFTMSIPLSSLEPSDGASSASGRVPGGEPSSRLRCPTDRQKLRILIVDDFEYTRKGIALLVEEAGDMEIVGEAADGETAVRLAELQHPDVVVMDVNLPGMSGIDATRLIVRNNPGIAVIALSMHEDESVVAEMREAGAESYLSKAESPRLLVGAIRSCRPHRATPS